MSAPSPRAPRIAVVGAGIAGLSCARRLHAAGAQVQVFDKARGRGGRASTHRAAAVAFDSGAQYFTAKSAAFRAAVAEWSAAGAAAEWDGLIVELANGDSTPVAASGPRFVGTPGMSGIGNHLARGLDSTPRYRVSALVVDRGAATLVDETGRRAGTFDAVAFAIPGPQLAPIVAPHAPELAKHAAAARYTRCIALLVGLPDRLDLPFDGATVAESELAWIARNGAKPGRPAGECWVLHAEPDWSEANFERPDAELARELRRAFRTATRIELPTATYERLHRWRYAFPVAPAAAAAAAAVATTTEPCWLEITAAIGLGAAGDWFTGPRIEDAFASGTALADRLLAHPALERTGR